ncbi:hypothetical protein [Anaerovibrio sp. RM50]|uniref:hypothetical protein n=1 Tax=Anaerovibrio sp. RM50 TaxID=1200557 RepID=UPI00055FC6BE|nr:hypothetical protein [Anaerovibrio sp. RM50]
MNLKEAFQMQNKLGELLDRITEYLSDYDNVMTITEKHLRSKALAGQQDEEVDASNKEEEGYDVAKLLTIWQDLMAERKNLGLAIGKAKEGMPFNLDVAVDNNKDRHRMINTLHGLANAKSAHRLEKGAGTAYVFNNDGNQTAYHYDIDVIKTINYDRNRVRNMIKDLHREAEEISIKIDEALLQTEVDFTPKYDLSGEDWFILEELAGK